MFQQPKDTPPRVRKAAASESAVTILTASCHFSGKLYCRGSSRIGGKVEGEIVSEGMLIIEDDAQITAEIKADEVIVQGTVEGQLQAQGRVELCASARVNGDISTPSLVIHEGAQFNGRSTMLADPAAGRSGGKSRDKSPRLSEAAMSGSSSAAVPEVQLN